MNININMHGQGYPLVLFHGWGFDSAIWQPLIPELEKNFSLYCVDLPGFGLSKMIEWESFKLQLLENLPSQFALLGWSLGGLYATRLATEIPHRVSHLVNIASSPRFLACEQWAGINANVLKDFYISLSTDSATTLKEFQALQKFSPIPPQKNMPSTAGLKAGLDALYNWDLRDALHHFNNPTCFMFGRLDAITPLATLTHMQARYTDFYYVVFRKSAHIPFLSESAQFLEELKGFLL